MVFFVVSNGHRMIRPRGTPSYRSNVVISVIVASSRTDARVDYFQRWAASL
jgi:hypothetical protein